ncbi:hypothetical protein B0H34DRAFT_801209 [Crassisporium funariophilum]|nr:hypothetical protein B0H34DRAFT_801209 [Crassisporium funariophilum]
MNKSQAILPLLRHHRPRQRTALHTSPPAPNNTNTDARKKKITPETGEHTTLGTDSAEYDHLDTDPTSSTPPYELPEKSGKELRLRYGGRGAEASDGLEASGSVGEDEGPEGRESGGRKPEPDRR